MSQKELGEELDEDIKSVVVITRPTLEAVGLLHELQAARDFIACVATAIPTDSPDEVVRAIALRARSLAGRK